MSMIKKVNPLGIKKGKQMRRMSDGVEAALHCALLLAALPSGKVLTGKSLAEFHGVSESYLLKHLRSLTAANVIEAIPGPKGGYRLTRDPSAISMLDVVEAIDGREPAFTCRNLWLNSCGKTFELCDNKMECFIKVRMLAAEELWRNALRGQTLADLIVDGEQQIRDDDKKIIYDFLTKVMR